jgi:hypothetical protein
LSRYLLTIFSWKTRDFAVCFHSEYTEVTVDALGTCGRQVNSSQKKSLRQFLVFPTETFRWFQSNYSAKWFDWNQGKFFARFIIYLIHVNWIYNMTHDIYKFVDIIYVNRSCTVICCSHQSNWICYPKSYDRKNNSKQLKICSLEKNSWTYCFWLVSLSFTVGLSKQESTKKKDQPNSCYLRRHKVLILDELMN